MEKELDEIIKHIGKNLESIRKKRIGFKKRTKKQALIALVRQKYREILLILERISLEGKRIQKIQKEWIDSYRGKTSFSQARGILMFKLNDQLKLDIKCLYLWIYDIHEIFEKHKAKINLAELKRLVLVRSKFITHITDTEFFKSSAILSTGVKTGGDKGSILILHDPFSKKNLFGGIKLLVKQCEQHLHNLRGITNQYEQIQFIFENRSKLPSTLQAQLKKQIDKTGIATESPAKIALLLLKTLKQFRTWKKV